MARSDVKRVATVGSKWSEPFFASETSIPVSCIIVGDPSQSRDQR